MPCARSPQERNGSGGIPFRTAISYNLEQNDAKRMMIDMYKLLAIDLDDTLLTDDLEITPATREALAEAAARGVTVTVATGRMFASAVKIARSLELNVPIITYQGALVKNSHDGKVLYERTVPPGAARRIYEYCRDRGLHLQAYVDDILYAREDNDKIKAYAELTGTSYVVEPDFDALIRRPQTKLLIIDEPDTLDRARAELAEMVGKETHITKSKARFLEFTHPEGTKGSALRFLAGHTGCSMSETIAIGDSWNDHDMVKAAGLGVAMGNAVEALKEIADFITSSNNEEGVKQVIDRFILQKI